MKPGEDTIFPNGDGEMSQLVRSFDWSATTLGPIQGWPAELKTMTATILSSKFPMLICWGKDYVQLYNDQFRPINGISKHPDALGKSARHTYAEIWQTIGPMFEGVMQGESFRFANFMVPLNRRHFLEDCYFDFAFSPIKNPDDDICGVLVVCIETTEKVMAEKELVKTRDKLQMTMAAMELGTFDMDIRNRRMEWDNRCRELLGIKDDDRELVRTKFLEGVHPDDRQKVEKVIDKVLVKSELNGNYDIEHRTLGTDDHKLRWVRVVGKVYFDELDKPVRFVGSVMDISDRKTQEQLKDEFISIASHELKTPLTSIKAYNQLMLRVKGEEKLKDLVTRSTKPINRIEMLINDLLDVSKINAGKMNYAMQPFNFSQMLKSVVEDAREIWDSNEVLLENLPDTFYTGDAVRLEQVVNNFITNAVKYSPEGTQVVIAASIQQNGIVVSVKDFGIGIAPQNISRLFDRYYRVNNENSRFEGLGLGLFISSEILKRHAGSFWIESEPGKGSTFYFRLPLEKTTIPEHVESTDTHYKSNSVSITYNKLKNRLDVDWTGYQDLESVRQGCLMMLDIMQKNKVHKISNDNTHVLGSWSEAVEWTGNVWFPLMEKAGLQYFALIYSPSIFSQLSAKKSIDVGIGRITVQYFTELTLAEQWIDGCPDHPTPAPAG